MKNYKRSFQSYFLKLFHLVVRAALSESYSLELRLHLYNLADVGVAGWHSLVLLLHPRNLSCALLLLGASISFLRLRTDFGVGGLADHGLATLNDVSGRKHHLVELLVREGGLVVGLVERLD